MRAGSSKGAAQELRIKAMAPRTPSSAKTPPCRCSSATTFSSKAFAWVLGSEVQWNRKPG